MRVSLRERKETLCGVEFSHLQAAVLLTVTLYLEEYAMRAVGDYFDLYQKPERGPEPAPEAIVYAFVYAIEFNSRVFLFYFIGVPWGAAWAPHILYALSEAGAWIGLQIPFVVLLSLFFAFVFISPGLLILLYALSLHAHSSTRTIADNFDSDADSSSDSGRDCDSTESDSDEDNT
jgi:hypothetical protein